VAEEPSPNLKNPRRTGPFKDAFRNRVVLVYGTKGTPEESAWALAKARYDAETFWYRGNGSLEIVADTAFAPRNEKERNVVLYGNSETNGAWSALLSQSPITVTRTEVRAGDHISKGDDLACLFIAPRPQSATALIGVVSGTGLTGLRLTDRIPYFVSGVAYPDFTLLSAASLKEGLAGVKGTGFLGPHWDIGQGEFVWNP
jgi:hypothetical protein